MARMDSLLPASLFISRPSLISQPYSSLISIFTPSSPRNNNSQISVSLYNGHRNFIVTGPPRALYYGHVANLRKIRVPKGSHQSKVEFSKRKPVLSTRFLRVIVGAPFHSQGLASFRPGRRRRGQIRGRGGISALGACCTESPFLNITEMKISTRSPALPPPL